MAKFWNLALIAVAVAGVAACDAGVANREQIVLPEGNVERGEAAFVALQCTSCHTIRDRELPPPEEMGPVTIALGGQVTKLKSYSELVTSVINPSHKLARNPFDQEIAQDGESVMTIYNDVMTVSQLVDIVAFLDSEYDVIERPGYRYPSH